MRNIQKMNSFALLSKAIFCFSVLRNNMKTANIPSKSFAKRSRNNKRIKKITHKLWERLYNLISRSVTSSCELTRHLYKCKVMCHIQRNIFVSSRFITRRWIHLWHLWPKRDRFIAITSKIHKKKKINRMKWERKQNIYSNSENVWNRC